MSKFKQFLAAKVLLILVAAAGLTYIDSITPLKLGLDLNGGTQLDYSIDMSEVADEDVSQIVEGVQEVIRRRVDSLGVSEPNIYSSNIGDEYHVIVELAGISDIEEAKATVGKTIQLEFREENTDVDAEKTEWATTASSNFYAELSAGGDFETLADAALEDEGGEAKKGNVDLQPIDEYYPEIEALIDGKEGDVVLSEQISSGFVIDGSGMSQENTGFFVMEITEKGSEERVTEVEEKVSARHILISFAEAESGNNERSQASLT